MKRKPSAIESLVLGAIAATLLIAVLVVIFARRDFAHDVHYAGTPVEPAKVATDALLVDQTAHRAHLLAPSYDATFVFFGYSHCPDECPLALATLGRAYRSLTPAVRSRTRVVFVTVDPAHDTPAVLGSYIAHFDPHIVALTDTHDALSKVWQAYGVEVEPQAKELVGHGGTIYAIDRTGHALLVYPPDVKASDIVHDATALAMGANP